MYKEKHNLIGKLDIAIYDSLKNAYSHLQVKNLITTKGKETLAKHFINNISGALTFHIAVGTGSTAAQEADTALETQIQEVTATASYVEGALTPSIRVEAEIPALAEGEATQLLTEAGIKLGIEGQADKVLYNHVIFPVVSHTQSTTLSFAWDISF